MAKGGGCLTAVVIGALVVSGFALFSGRGGDEPKSPAKTADVLAVSEYRSWWSSNERTAQGADWYLYLDGYTIYSTYLEIHTLLPESATGAADRVCGFFSTIRAVYPEAGKIRVSGASGKHIATC